jgi:hypothetical protein
MRVCHAAETRGGKRPVTLRTPPVHPPCRRAGGGLRGLVCAEDGQRCGSREGASLGERASGDERAGAVTVKADGFGPQLPLKRYRGCGGAARRTGLSRRMRPAGAVEGQVCGKNGLELPRLNNWKNALHSVCHAA